MGANNALVVVTLKSTYWVTDPHNPAASSRELLRLFKQQIEQHTGTQWWVNRGIIAHYELTNQLPNADWLVWDQSAQKFTRASKLWQHAPQWMSLYGSTTEKGTDRL